MTSDPTGADPGATTLVPRASQPQAAPLDPPGERVDNVEDCRAWWTTLGVTRLSAVYLWALLEAVRHVEYPEISRPARWVLEMEGREGTTCADIAILASGARGREAVLANGRMDDGLAHGPVPGAHHRNADVSSGRRVHRGRGRRNGPSRHARARVMPAVVAEPSHAI